MTRNFIRGALGLCLCAGALACAGDPESPTEIAIEITSDLQAPAEIDRVDIAVGNLVTPQHASADLTKQDFPRHLTLVHKGGPFGPIRITVTGYLGSLKLVQRIVEISFSSRNTKSLAVRLERACLANFCDRDTTCVQGVCRTYAGVDPNVDAGNASDAASSSPGDSGGGGEGTGGAGSGDAGEDSGVDGGPDAGPRNHPPTCSISAPTPNQTLYAGLPVDLSGSCTDPERGTLSGSELNWSAGYDQTLGRGTTLEANGPTDPGSETFKLCVVDPDDSSLSACARVTVIVKDLPLPTAKITSYVHGVDQISPFVQGGKPITFKSSVTGQEVKLEWSDTFVGAFSTGAAPSLDTEVGVHTVTLVVKDVFDTTASDQVQFTVLPSDGGALVRPFTNVNSVVTGAVRVLAADSASQVLAFGSGASPKLQRFDGTDLSATASAAFIDDSAMTDTINTLLIVESTSPKRIYIGTSNGLLVCTYAPGAQIDQATCTTFLAGQDISAIARTSVSSNDYLLLGTANGLFMPDSATGSNTCLDANTNTKCDVIWGGERICAIVAQGGLFWFASTSSGLHSVDPTKDGAMDSPSGGPTSLRALVKDQNGDLWAGSDNGIAGFNTSDGTWSPATTTSSKPPGLAGNDVQALASQRVSIAGTDHDALWIATSTGVSRFDPAVPSFMTLHMAEGLLANNVRAIAVLPSGEKLFGTNAGIVMYRGN